MSVWSVSLCASKSLDTCSYDFSYSYIHYRRLYITFYDALLVFILYVYVRRVGSHLFQYKHWSIYLFV